MFILIRFFISGFFLRKCVYCFRFLSLAKAKSRNRWRIVRIIFCEFEKQPKLC